MSTVYLNGTFLPASEAKISPMDRGFLFGDGIYEVIPSYGGRFVGFGAHIERMQSGLSELAIQPDLTDEQWHAIASKLLDENRSELGENIAIYIQVSRGADSKRGHAFPANITPTVFAFAMPIAPAPQADKNSVTTFSVITAPDLRWQRCHIKSTSLLGNVLHFQQSKNAGADEILLLDRDGNLTEGAAVNVFIVKDGIIATPPLSNKLLPGITRKLLLAILAEHSNFSVQQRDISEAEVLSADEIWLTSSSKEIAPVIKINGKPVGNGKVGDVWLQVQQLFTQYKFDY